jgi:hypothetical protein
MTAIFYPDCRANSPNGKFTLEARSPHNGTIRHRDGRPASEDEFGFKYREHQNEFRYQLLENTSGHFLQRLLGRDRRLVWERWQGKGEDSPHELVVSDDGWSILRAHGFRPELIAVDSSGKDVVRVRIAGDGAEHTSPPPTGAIFSCNPAHLEFSTAGLYWSGDSWRYFPPYGDRPHFVWRTSWGQRLVIDLASATLVAESAQAAPQLALTLIEHEQRGVYNFLAGLSPRMAEVRELLSRKAPEARDEEHPPHPLEDQLRSARSALYLAGVHRVKECVPFLREWEEIDYPSVSMGSIAMGKGWSMECQHFRPILHHSLRLLGEEPHGFPTYHFTDNNKQRFPLAERVADRPLRARRVAPAMSAEQVLQLIGSPDHVTSGSHPFGKIHCWTEAWEYDFRFAGAWQTWRITWKEGWRKAWISSMKLAPSSWLQSDERESEILRF